MDLDVLLSHEESRQALGLLVQLTVPHAKRVMQYVRLFKPATRAMSHSRTVKLLAEILPDLERCAIRHNGRDWAAPHDVWAAAIERMLERRDAGKLQLPLKSHNYLYEVIQGLVDSGEAVAERAAEETRRQRAAPTIQDGAASLASAIEQAVTPSTPLPTTARPPAGPSRHALEVQAQIRAHQAARSAPPPTEGDVE